MVLLTLVAALLASLFNPTTSVTSGRLRSTSLRLRITRIEVNSIEMTWHLENPQHSQLNTSACRLLYSTSGGPQLLVLAGLRPHSRTFSLHLPHGDWAYSVRLSCPLGDTALTSNRVQFTFEPLPGGAPTLLPYRSQSTEPERPAAAAADAGAYHNRPLVRAQSGSSHILLGIGCGLVGLVVVNTTLILLIRRYTRRRQRRRREELFRTFGPAAFQDEELVYHITA
ncbi:uncharacterized protein LOC119110526 [Pollicipes pollicipes]|uniref:uncharacterized protein LOC119110526 n=1 Tax=Pollicipes pollicipes TaxID=41117 RepID=UPI0018857F8C|nr:uncharacterized protein LOC119110526 [Pollicipes pollicipes]